MMAETSFHMVTTHIISCFPFLLAGIFFGFYRCVMNKLVLHIRLTKTHINSASVQADQGSLDGILITVFISGVSRLHHANMSV